MRVSLDIPRAVLEVKNAKQRHRVMAEEMRKAADRIEKGQGKVGYYLSMSDGNDEVPVLVPARGSSASTNLSWTSPEELRRQRARRRASMKELAVG